MTNEQTKTNAESELLKYSEALNVLLSDVNTTEHNIELRVEGGVLYIKGRFDDIWMEVEQPALEASHSSILESSKNLVPQFLQREGVSDANLKGLSVLMFALLAEIVFELRQCAKKQSSKNIYRVDRYTSHFVAKAVVAMRNKR